MFVVALFTIAKVWNQPRCPSTNGVLFFLKKNEIMSSAGKTIMLSKISQTEKDKYC
jgi:hypothetical protein